MAGIVTGNNSTDVIDEIFKTASDVVNKVKDDRTRTAILTNLANLKSSLTADDKQLILVYFRWLTRRGARKLGITNLERVGSASAEFQGKLEPNLATVTDWQFTGMTNLGDSGCKCKLCGHRIQYAYFAYSKAADTELCFGSDCGSRFFQVDLCSLNSLSKITDEARLDLAQVLIAGGGTRGSKLLANSIVLQCIHVMERKPALAAMCVQYMGPSTFELAANFVNRGLIPPNKLTHYFIEGYYLGVKAYLAQLPNITPEVTKLCKETLDNEHSMNIEGFLHNPGIRKDYNNETAQEFLFPLSSAGLMDALEASCLMELYNPTPLSAAYDMEEVIEQIQNLRKAAKDLNYENKLSTAEAIYAYLFDKQNCPFTDVVSMLAYGVLSDNLRLVLFMLGLTPNSQKLNSLVLRSHGLNLGINTDINEYFDEDDDSEVFDDEDDVAMEPEVYTSAVLVDGSYKPRFGTYSELLEPNAANELKVGNGVRAIPNLFGYCWLRDTDPTIKAPAAMTILCEKYFPKRALLILLFTQNYDAILKALPDIVNKATVKPKETSGDIDVDDIQDLLYGDTQGTDAEAGDFDDDFFEGDDLPDEAEDAEFDDEIYEDEEF